MISSASTLFLATLVLTTSVCGAPVRLSAAPEIVARAESVPQLVARAAVVDVQPSYRPSPGVLSRRSARLLTEREPEVEAPVARELVEEPELQRRYPRRVYQEYYQKREPQPEPVGVPAPVLQKRDRVYPRRVYYEYYERRSPEPQPATTIKETTVTVKKLSTFDTPADLAAANSAQLLSGGSVGTSATTLSFSQTQTIATPDPAATPAEIVNGGNGAAVAGTAPPATVTASVTGSASSTDSASVVTATGSTSSTSSASVVTATSSASSTTTTQTGATGSTSSSTDTNTATPPASNTDPSGSTNPGSTDTATPPAGNTGTSGSASPASNDTAASPAANTNTSGSAGPVPTVTATPPAGNIDTSGSTVPASTDPATEGGSTDLPPNLDQVSGGVESSVPAPGRRDLLTTEPLVRRSYSGAAWASFVRRQSN